MFGQEREKFHYNVELMDEKGNKAKYPVSTYWDPERVTTEEIAVVGAAEASRIAAKKYVPLRAERVLPTNSDSDDDGYATNDHEDDGA